MKPFLLFVVALATFSSAAAPPVTAQQTVSASSAAAPADVDRIIRAFTAKETEFRQALNQYSFKREAVIQTIGLGGQISGEYNRVSQFVFDDQGNRFEKIIRFPMPTLEGLNVTQEDLDDLGGIQPFALETAKIGQYNLTYVGKETIDELTTHVLDVAPKVVPDPKKSKERFFQGRIWVDDRDLQIVKARGKGIPESKDNRFPTFETYREQIDGRYWFPTYTFADEQLVFDKGHTVHFRMRVRYTDFERFRGKLRVIEEEDPPIEQAPPQQKSPAPASTPAQPKKP